VTAHSDRTRDLQLVDQVDALNEEVKILALNLAIYLARAKGTSEQLARLEPEFIRLVNGTVKVVQQLAEIINAARNPEQGLGDIQVERIAAEQIEIRLRSILDQCTRILEALSKSGKLSL
jgi:hypothetical protein